MTMKKYLILIPSFLLISAYFFVKNDSCAEGQEVYEEYYKRPAIFYTCLDCEAAINIDSLGYFIRHEPLIKNTKKFIRMDELNQYLSLDKLASARHISPSIRSNGDIRFFAIGIKDDIVTIDSNGVICELGRCIQLTEKALNRVDKILVEHRQSKALNAR